PLKKRCFWRESWKEIFGVLRYCRAQQFDLALDFQGLFKSAALARLSGAPRRIGMARADRREPWTSFFLNEFSAKTLSLAHIIEKNLAMLDPLDIVSDNQPLRFHIYSDPESEEYVDQELQK